MRNILAFIAILFTANAQALKPGKCVPALNDLGVKLQTQNKLGTPLRTELGEDYKYKSLPNICILVGMKGASPKTWLIHKNKDDVTVIIEERYIETETVKSNYYGPFKSAYKK